MLAFARKSAPPGQVELDEQTVMEKITWVGMLTFNDPVRVDVKESLAKARTAGISLIVITGDYANTAVSVLKELDLHVDQSKIILGEALDNMSDDDLKAFLLSDRTEVKLFARTKPNQKLKIVEILKLHGEVVAMTGDGVNDAPALSRSDIGIVVEEASDVSKESADLILLDSSFNTIVAAVEEGRGIFDNIRKIILYLMSDAFEEILIVITFLVMKVPIPISAVQILWINLVSDGFPHLALTIDPKTPGAMQKPPRSPTELLVAPWMTRLIAIVSVTGWFFALGAYFYIMRTTGDDLLARSVIFATIGLNSLVYVFSIRTLQEPFWKEGFFDNKWLLVAVGAGLCLQILPYLFEPLRAFFDLVPLGAYWFIVVLASISMFFVIEVAKWVFRHKLKAHST